MRYHSRGVFVFRLVNVVLLLHLLIGADAVTQADELARHASDPGKPLSVGISQNPLNLPAICQAPHRTFLPLAVSRPLSAATVSASAPVSPALPIRAVGVRYTDLFLSRSEVASLQANLDRAHSNFVALAAGRMEWTYFKWADHPERWSSAVRDSQLDYLAEDIVNYGTARHRDAMVDMLAPLWIQAHPADAAIGLSGSVSAEQVSTAALVNGAYGQQVLEMVGYLAANYALDSISITELFYYDTGYGPDDLALYRADTGQTDWPRRADGAINPDDPALGLWRSQKLAGWLQRASACAHNHGKEFYLDVRISWGNLPNESRENGQYYPTMLDVVDKLILWGYADLAGYSPAYLGEVAGYLVGKHPANRFIMSVGLWGPNGTVISAGDLQTAMQSSRTRGLPDLWITPSHMISAEHWAILATEWP